MNIYISYIILGLKYAAAATILIVILLAPAYLARQTKKKGLDMVMIRIASWLFGWTGVGWLWALYWATKK